MKGLINMAQEQSKPSSKKTPGEDDLMGITKQTISSGSLAVDIATGVQGWPRGKIVELFGPECGGRTTLGLHFIAEARKLGLSAALLDADRAIEPETTERLGVNLDEIHYLRPKSLEEAFAVIERLILKDGVKAVVVDSIAALLPVSRVFDDFSPPAYDHDPGITIIIKEGVRRLLPVIDDNNVTILFINQVDRKVGVMFGNPETVSFGTDPIKLFATIRAEVRRIQAIKVRSNVIGNRIRVRILKNRMAPPFHTAEFDIMYADGISKESDLLDLGVQMDLITKRGAHYSYGEEQLGQGRENAKCYLRDNVEVAQEIEEHIRQKHFFSPNDQ